jgi:hypothetical protein
MTPIDEYYNRIEEPYQGAMLAIKDFILSLEPNLNLKFKYQMPFICYNNKLFCYNRIEKKTGNFYLSFSDGFRIEHPLLQSEGRKRCKLLQIDVQKDLPFIEIKEIVMRALLHC